MGLMTICLDHKRMLHALDSDRRVRAASPLIRNDLCAQITPLDRYGPAGLGAALADGLLALVGVTKTALFAAVRCSEA